VTRHEPDGRQSAASSKAEQDGQAPALARARSRGQR
jgi:hypothetical protein